MYIYIKKGSNEVMDVHDILSTFSIFLAPLLRPLYLPGSCNHRKVGFPHTVTVEPCKIDMHIVTIRYPKEVISSPTTATVRFDLEI